MSTTCCNFLEEFVSSFFPLKWIVTIPHLKALNSGQKLCWQAEVGHSSFEMKKSGDQFPRKVTTCSRHYKPKLILPLKSVLLYKFPFTLKIAFEKMKLFKMHPIITARNQRSIVAVTRDANLSIEREMLQKWQQNGLQGQNQFGFIVFKTCCNSLVEFVFSFFPLKWRVINTTDN